MIGVLPNPASENCRLHSGRENDGSMGFADPGLETLDTKAAAND
jgi:hypothetical protein